MSNHTPGPWKIEYDELTEEWFVYWKRGYAAVGGFYNEPNAKLISAAPEMLDAIILSKDLLEQGNPRTAMTVLSESAAKATGETYER